MVTLESAAAGSLVEAPAAAGGRPAVEVAHLRKTYGTLVAVDDVSFTVTEGEIFGILGPNGAGKTTAIECAIGLRRPDAGTIRLLGLDPHADRDQVHEIVGVQLQSGALPAKLRVGEILEEYRSFYRDPADVDELLDVLGLAAKRGDYYRSLSGGQRQRLSVALALIGRPQDRGAGRDDHRPGPAGPPGHLGADRADPRPRRDDRPGHPLHGGSRTALRPRRPDRPRPRGRAGHPGPPGRPGPRRQDRAVPAVRARSSDRLLTGLPEVSRVERDGQHVVVTGTGELVNAVILALHAAGVTARDVQLDSSNLEDAFVKLTGKNLHSEGALA